MMMGPAGRLQSVQACNSHKVTRRLHCRSLRAVPVCPSANATCAYFCSDGRVRGMAKSNNSELKACEAQRTREAQGKHKGSTRFGVSNRATRGVWPPSLARAARRAQECPGGCSRLRADNWDSSSFLPCKLAPRPRLFAF